MLSFQKSKLKNIKHNQYCVFMQNQKQDKSINHGNSHNPKILLCKK